MGLTHSVLTLLCSVVNVFFFLVCIELASYIDGYKVECVTGHNFITEQFPLEYAVTELPVDYSCFPSDFESNSVEWPGPPQNLNVVKTYNNFSLSWQPPDDSSIQHMTGFLLRLFVEDLSPVYTMDPDLCLFVNISQIQVPRTAHRGKFVQDLILNVKCRLLVQLPLDVTLFLTSLPLPSIQRQYKEITKTIHFEVEPQMEEKVNYLPVSNRSSRKGKQLISVENSGGINESSIIAVAVVIVSVVLITVIIFTVCHIMKHQYNQEHIRSTSTPNNSKAVERDIERSKESLVTEAGPLPEKYQQLFMTINSDT